MAGVGVEGGWCREELFLNWWKRWNYIWQPLVFLIMTVMSHNCQLISTFGILELEKRRLRLLWGGKDTSLARLEVPISRQRSHDCLGQRIVVWPGSAKCSMDFNHGSPWISPLFFGEVWRSFGWCSPPWRTTNSGRALKKPIQGFDILSKMLRKNMLATGGFLMPFYKFLIPEGSVSQFAIEGGRSHDLLVLTGSSKWNNLD